MNTGTAVLEPKNILHVFTTLPVGGAENVLLSTLRHLDSRRYRSVVCCIRDQGALGVEVERLGIPLLTLGLLHKGGWDSRIVKELVDVMTQTKADLVHSHLYHANFYARLAARRAGLPAVITVHNTYSKPKLHRRLINRWLGRSTARVIAVSQDIKRDVMRYDHVSGERIDVIPNGIDVQRSLSSLSKREARLRLGVPAESMVLGCVGRLEQQKGHRFLLEALVDLLKWRSDCYVVIVGDGRERANLASLAVELGVSSHVSFLGNRSDVGDVLKALDLFVMPSLWEGLALAMLEAMAAQVPVIITNVGGVADVVGDNEYGFRIPPGSPQAIVEQVRRCFDDWPATQATAVRAAEQVNNHYSADAMVARVQRIYEQLLY